MNAPALHRGPQQTRFWFAGVVVRPYWLVVVVGWLVCSWNLLLM